MRVPTEERRAQVGEMASMKIARPGEKIVFDIFGPLPVSLKGNVYLLVMMDVGTREMMLEPLKTRAAVAIYKRIYLSGRSLRVYQSVRLGKGVCGKRGEGADSPAGIQIQSQQPIPPADQHACGEVQQDAGDESVVAVAETRPEGLG